MIPDFAGFRQYIDRHIQIACVRFLGWKQDEIRKLMRDRIVDWTVSEVVMFFNRRRR